jgi:L-alanine-DL-glutamate epimerase-like enolase superfamily enzyme
MRIAAVETRRYSWPWDPPLRVAWDPEPRLAQEATIVIVRSDDGLEGYASGDALPDRALLERLLVGVDPLRSEVVRELCETVDFHHARPWTVEVAVWDLAGRALDVPCWRLLGGRQERLLAYASCAELVPVDVRIARCLALRAAGVRAAKIRFHHPDWREDVADLAALRDAVGPAFELMVDANHGWRMPGDLTPRWDVATAAQCARELERLGVYWLEEPLRCDDPEGYRALRGLTDIRIAAGEMARTASEARDLGVRRVAALAELHGRTWTPHTWSNGYGLVANLHLALAVSGCPYVEVPFDPPTLPASRRDWLLPEPVEIDGDGWIAPPAGPGLGVVPDFDALERWRIE